MRTALKILKWFVIALVIILSALAGTSILLQDKIAGVFLTSVNKTLSTKIETGRIHFSLISRFPKASVKFENFLVRPSSHFDRTQFMNINTDTLLFARSAICEFNISDIIKGHYNIENISVINGRLYLLSDSAGGINYDISTGKSASADSNFYISLEKVTMSNISVVYNNKATSLFISGIVKNSRLKSRFSGNYIDLTATSAMQVSRLEIFPVFLRSTASASVDLNLHKSDSGYIFKKGSLKIDNFTFGISGNISNNNDLNLKISGKNIDISRIRKFLPAGYQKRFSEYDPSGVLKIDAALSGLTDRTHNPGIKLDFSLEKGSVVYKKSKIKLENISFAGTFTNGKHRRKETSILVLNKVAATLGSATYSGTFLAENLLKPKISLSLSGKVYPSELSEFFNIKELSGAGGSAEINLKLSGAFINKDKYSLTDILNLHPSAEIRLSSMTLGIDSGRILLKDINGKMKIAKNVRADSISFYNRDQYFMIDGDFLNLPAWVAGQNVVMQAYCDLTAKNLYPGLFLKDSVSAGSEKSIFKFPKNVEIDANLNVENMKYRKISADNMKGKVLYRPGLLSVKSLDINALDGNISGDFFLAQGEKNTYISHGNFNFENIDIHKAFASFRNFGQDFIKAENIAGTLSGKLSLLLPLDAKLEPISRLTTAEGKYVITDGALTNFEPVKSLSKFIELSELENIKFSRLENDFYIKNSYVVTPQMEIRSTVADFTVSGKHGFGNDYEYHVKTYLSVLLSKKVKKNKKSNEEFGAIEDDGLGRSSVFLKITGTGENLKVSYDLKAAGVKIKQNLKSEKESLKNILNKEYGWYKKDSAASKQEITVKPRFRIEWDESDSTGTRPDTIIIKKDKGINSIFKKKKGQSPEE